LGIFAKHADRIEGASAIAGGSERRHGFAIADAIGAPCDDLSGRHLRGHPSKDRLAVQIRDGESEPATKFPAGLSV
jgi:hypothetical protein